MHVKDASEQINGGRMRVEMRQSLREVVMHAQWIPPSTKQLRSKLQGTKRQKKSVGLDADEDSSASNPTGFILSERFS